MEKVDFFVLYKNCLRFFQCWEKDGEKSETQLSVFNYGLKSEIQIEATVKFTCKKNKIIYSVAEFIFPFAWWINFFAVLFNKHLYLIVFQMCSENKICVYNLHEDSEFSRHISTWYFEVFIKLATHSFARLLGRCAQFSFHTLVLEQRNWKDHSGLHWVLFEVAFEKEC